MGKLEEQLRRAEAKADVEAPKSKGGPVYGVPDDRWIAYHATMGSRSAAQLVTVMSIVLFGVGGLFLGFAGNWLGVAIVSALGVVAIAIGATVHLVHRSGAAMKQRRYLATLPFKLEGYLETMRQPKWHARESHVVVYKPKLAVTWQTPPGDSTVDKLATLADARFDRGTFEPISSSVADPWAWARDVVSEVLIPLREKAEVATAELTVNRDIEYSSGGD